MKKILLLFFAVTYLFFTPVFADINERSDLFLFLDAGIPLKDVKGRYQADMGRSFLEFAALVRLGEKFHFECSFAYYPSIPESADVFNIDGFEVTAGGLWKIAPGKKIDPFIKIGLSHVWINYNRDAAIYFPDTGRGKDRLFGLNAGGGVECTLSRMLILRLGGVFTLLPADSIAWLQFFAGFGFRF